MKTAVFICLVSLSLCLGQPTKPEDPAAQQAAATPDPKTQNAVKPGDETKYKGTTEQVVIVTTSDSPKTTQIPTQGAGSDVPPKETKSKDTKPQAKPDNKASEKKEDASKTNESKPVTPNAETKPATTDGKDNKSATNETKTTEKPKSETTTQQATTAKPSEKPKDTTEKPIVQGRSFDATSFFGGIVLALGMLAIGFMGFKYYKNQTERNYHTL